MALEATKRLNSSSKSITAYRFRDVSFSSALVINSSSQGVETQLIIRPHRQESSKLESRWNEFRLFVYDNSTWSECCRGTISLEHHEPTWASESAGKDFDFLKKEVQPTKDRCESTLPNDYFYQVLSNSGLEYGPSFRGVGAVKGDYGGRATGIIDLHHWETHATERIEEHLIHPTALDSILHMALFTLFKSHTDKIPTVVPTAFKELWISEAITRETHIEACSYSTPQGFRNIDARLVGIGLGSNQVCLTADLVITALGDAKDDAVEHTPGDRKLYHLDWEPDVTAIKDERSLLSIVQKTNRIPMRNGTGHANSAKQRELLCQLVIREVLEKHVIATPGSSSHLSRYLDWMRYHTEKKKGTNSTPEQSQLEAMFDVVEQQGPIGELTVKVAKGLPTVLNGNIDPLEFFFSDDLLHRAYRSSSLWPANTLPQLCRYIELLAMKNPSIRILEIGAGTGSLTESILGALASHPTDYSHAPLYQEYVFTDISTGFFANAKMQFPDPKITFKVLDISQCPVKQGFEAESYDIVLASNVLHATSKLKTTLSNCRKLIKPGGRFILHECMSPRTLMPGFIFGLIPGWWAGTEPTRRWSPLISRSEWGVQLVEAGFPGGAELTIRDESEEDKEHPSAAVIVTTAPLRLSSASGPVSPSIIVVYNKSVSVQHAIAKEFQQQASTKQTAPVQVIDLEAARSVDVTGARCIFLVDVDVSFTKELQEPDLMLLKRACSDAQQILWITGASNRDESAEPSNGIIVGVARTVETEKPDLCFVTLNLEAPYDISRVCNHMTTVLESSGARSSPLYESEYAEIDGVLNVHRLVEAKQATRGIFEHDQRAVKTVSKWDGESDVRFKLGIGTLGLLDSLKHVEDVAPSSELRPDELDVEIVCAGLNFRDVLTALGQVDDDYFGSEFSGRVIRAGETARRRFSTGDSVMGFHKGTMASVIRCGDYQIHPLPSGLSFAAGASLPVVYCTAYYSLVTWAKARRGESVLIHSAAGGFGQASIQLCKSIGCQIYATVSSQEKAEMLVETYGVQRDHIFSSRTLDFAKGIKRVSNGKGVDIVLNSLAGEALRASWECIAPFGRFIEVGKKDIFSKEISVHSGLHMAPFAHTVMFASVNLNQISEHRDRIREIFERVVEMVESRTIGPPQPLNVFGSHEIERAFRFMQDGKRFGKVLVDYSVEEMVEMERLPMRRKIFHAHATYIISGGLGGIGMSICRWMVRKGARNVILFSRSQAVDEERRLFLSDMKNAGSKVVGIPCDISNRDQLTTAIRDIQSEMPPIKGCIQAAMVLHNVAFTNMSMEAWNSAINPKVHGSWNMHSLLPGGMDFFILLSSLSGVIGSYGQTNYTAGNAYQDELARYRVRNGEKAISIDLGSVKSVGYVASREDIQAYTERLGIDTVSERNLFQMLEYYCDPALPVQSELEAQVVTPMRTPAYFRSRGMVEPLWTRKSLFRLLHRVGQKDSVTTAAAAHMPSIERLLKQSASMLDAGEVVCQALRDRLAELLAVNRVDIDPTKPVHAYGVDSLAAVELKSWFKRMIGADVPVFELLGNGTIAELADKAARRSTIVKGLE
jgi:NADPH:quinone reductase-like Zn-dependent oxidoreductase/SAM-dependent methyltransferase/aryl carrier-like protein